MDAGSNEDMENSGYKEEWAIQSGFFRLNYDYMGKYLVEVNTRLDGTSRIASENRWGWFPSFSLGYRITEEEFVKNQNWAWLSNLKLRASWGQLGNQNIGLYPYQAVVDLTDNYSFDNIGDYQRTIYNAFINSAIEAEDDKYYKNRTFSSFDLYPTTLASLGVEIEDNKMGLGVNLFSDEKTLLEKYDYYYVLAELYKRSIFYDDCILNDICE